MSETEKDREVVRRCAYEGDGDAWESFVLRYSPVIWASVQKTFRSHLFPSRSEDVEDVFNSVFLALIENNFAKLKQYRGDNSCSLQTWLAVVTVHMTIDYMRRDKRHLQVEPREEGTDIIEIIPDNRHSPQTVLEEKQTRLNLQKAVNGLQHLDRLIYRLLCERGLHPEEAAKILNLSVDNIYSRKNRIIRKLKESLSAMQET